MEIALNHLTGFESALSKQEAKMNKYCEIRNEYYGLIVTRSCLSYKKMDAGSTETDNQQTEWQANRTTDWNTGEGIRKIQEQLDFAQGTESSLFLSWNSGRSLNGKRSRKWLDLKWDHFKYFHT